MEKYAIQKSFISKKIWVYKLNPSDTVDTFETIEDAISHTQILQLQYPNTLFRIVKLLDSGLFELVK